MQKYGYFLCFYINGHQANISGFYLITIYSRYIAVAYTAELDISRSHVGPHYGNQSRGCLKVGSPLWPLAVPRGGGGCGGHLTSEIRSVGGGGLQGPPAYCLFFWRWRAWYFSRNLCNSLDPIHGRQFSRNLLTAIAFVPVRRRQFFAKSTLTCQCGLEHMLCDGRGRWADHWHLHCATE